ncbi:MAG: efflux RND transporter periplasmic adaptor subunit [Saprospiraceae bacterium]
MKPIINFYIENTPEGNLLKWVGNAKSRSSITVERSIDEINFNAIEEIILAKTDGEAFEFLDANTPNQKTFYQLKYYEGTELVDASPIIYTGEKRAFDKKAFITRIIAAAILILLAVLLVKNLSKKAPEPERPPLTQRSQYVNTETVAYTNHSTTIEALGQVIASQPIDIISEVSGKIEKGDVTLKKAIRFSQGSLLFQIENTETILNLKSQRSNFQNAIALILADMKLDFPNSYQIWQDYFNRIDINSSLPTMPEAADQREKTFLASRNIAGQFYSIKSAEERLNKYRVYAPYAGVIQQVYTDAGSVANPGTRVLRVRKAGDLELELPVRKEDIQWIKTGTRVKILSEDKRQSTTGTVNRIGTEIDPTTQSVNVYVSVRSGKIKLYEGMYLYAEISGSSIPKAMEINRKAIFDNNKIFVIEDSTLVAKTVNVHKVKNETVIFSGVTEGKIVAKETFLGAVDGMKIVPLN